ncbi:MAG: GerMN domain-containing protein [Dethiobacteria bacterium]
MNRGLGWSRALLLLLWVLLWGLCFPGCGPELQPREEFEFPEAQLPPEPGAGRVGLLYYPDQQWRFLVPVQREIPDSGTVVRTTLEKLVGTPQLREELEPLGLVPLLPSETTVFGIHIDEARLARVDFSRSFVDYNPSGERLVLGGLLCTLQQFSEIERLEVFVEGQSLDKFPGGTPGRIPLGPESLINLEVDDALKDYHNFTAVTVYFCFFAPQGRILYVPVTRALQPAEDSSAAAIEELLAGPRSGSGLFSDIPADTELRSLHLEEELIIIDLSEELLSYEGGRTGAENIVNQILLTLAQLEGVNKVQILVEGEKVKLPEGTDLTVPLEPPGVYNFF